MSQIDVQETDQHVTLKLPVNKDEVEKTLVTLKAKLTRFAEDAAKEFNIPVEKVLECIPNNIELQSMSLEAYKNPTKSNQESKTKLQKKPTTKAQDKKSRLNWEDWESATDKEQLKSLKANDLKNILSLKGLSITGTKSLLIDRVWSLISNDTSEIAKSTKKSRKKKSPVKNKPQNTNIVKDSDDEQTAKPVRSKIDAMLEDGSDIVYVDIETLEVYDNKKSVETEIECLFIPLRSWIFKNNSETVEFLGRVCDGKVSLCDPPQSLIDMSA